MTIKSKCIVLSKLKILIASALLFNAMAVKGQFDGIVKAWEDTLTLSTYKIHSPDVNPMFFRNQSYQGASRVIYPYPLQDNLSNDKIDVIYQALYLENKYIKVCVLPEIGGRLFYATDKTNNYEIFYRQHVIKPSNIGMLGAWISGGIEFCVFHHHRASSFLPIDYTITDNENGSCTIWIGETEPRHRMKWTIGITLHPDKSYLEVSGTLINTTENINSILYWANVATHANDDYQVIFPPSTQISTYHAKNSFSHWPITSESYINRSYYINGIDISWWKNHPEPVSFFAHDLSEGFLAGYDHGKRAGTMHVANPHIVAGAKLWEWGPGPRGAMWDTRVLTDNDGPYAELMAGAFSDNQPDYSWIKPYETKQFKQYWYPIRESSGAKKANLTGLLNLDLLPAQKIFIAANTTEEFNNAKIQLLHNSDILYEDEINISPSEPFHTQIDQPKEIMEENLKLILTDQYNNELISYQPEKRKEIKRLPDPVKPPRKPEEIESMEELYLSGLRIKQFHNARIDPEDYFMEALSRDPGDIRCNTEMGLYFKERGNYNLASEYLRKAIRRLTKNYTRPRNCEALYHLGLILQKQEKYENATDTLYRAVWDYEFRSAAYYHLAQISSIHKEFGQALKHINNSLITNSYNTSALNLKTSILRHLGKIEEAERNVTKVLNLDPISYWGLNEKYLSQLKSNDVDPYDYHPKFFTKIMRDNPESYIELAVKYMNCGLFNESIEILSCAANSGSETLRNYPTIYYYLGYLHHLVNKKDLALRNFQIARSKPTDYCFPYRLETLKVYETALKYSPDDSRAYYYRGNLFFDKQPDRAMEDWQMAVALEKDLSIAYRNLGWGFTYHLNQPERAIEAYESAIRYNPADPRYYYELDLLYEKQSVPVKKRLILLTENHQFVEKREDALIREIKVLVHAGNYDRAIEYLSNYSFHSQEGTRGLHEIHVDAHLLRGLQRIKNGEFQEALEDFLAANEYPENHQLGRAINYARNSQIEYFTAIAYELLDQPDLANQLFEKIINRDTKDNQYQYYVGQAFMKHNNQDEGITAFDRLISLGNKTIAQTSDIDFFSKFGETSEVNKRQSSGYFMMGLGYLGTGNKLKAKELFEKTLQLNPYHLWAKIFLYE